MVPRLVWGEGSAFKYLVEGYPDAVSDAGLVSVMLGDRDERNAIQVVSTYSSSDLLWQIQAEDLLVLPGVGPAKAARLLACIEMSRRIGVWRPSVRPIISTPADVFEHCWPLFRGSDRERFWTLALGTKNHLVKMQEVSVGSLNASIVHPRELFKFAVRVSAASVIVVHNHPSGDPEPSGADVHLTNRLIKAGDLLGIELLDHVVIGEGGRYTSLKELGLI